MFPRAAEFFSVEHFSFSLFIHYSLISTPQHMRRVGSGFRDAMSGLACARAVVPIHARCDRVLSAASTSQDHISHTLPTRNLYTSRHRRPCSSIASTSHDDSDSFVFGTLGSPGPGEGSAHQIAALTNWLREHGVCFGDRTRFCRIRGFGVGGIATKEMRQGDVIFSLPAFATSKNMNSDEQVPLIITTAAVMSHSGPLGRLGRALSTAGLVARDGIHLGDETRFDVGSIKTNQPAKFTQTHKPTHRLGGVRESDNEFPLEVGKTTLLALALLFQCAKAERPKKRKMKRKDGADRKTIETKIQTSAHWATYVDLLPRETDSLLEWCDRDLFNLKGSKHVERALERREIVNKVHAEVFLSLRKVDGGLFEIDGYYETSDDNEETEFDFATSKYSTPAAFRWAFATVLARAFELPMDSGYGRELGLCPGLDLFNHTDDAEHCRVEGLFDEDEEVDLTSTESLEHDSDDSSKYFTSDSDDDAFDDDERMLRSKGVRVTLRVGIGGAETGDQLFHKYADRSAGGSLLEFGFINQSMDGTRACDVSLEPLLLGIAPINRHKRLELLSQLNLCRGLTWEVSDAPIKRTDEKEIENDEFNDTPFIGSGKRFGVDCVPFEARLVARILTLSDAEFDGVTSWDDDNAGPYDGLNCFSAAHETRCANAMADLFKNERNALDLPRVTLTDSDERSSATLSDRQKRRRAMAVKVIEGEKTLLEEIIYDFESIASDE